MTLHDMKIEARQKCQKNVSVLAVITLIYLILTGVQSFCANLDTRYQIIINATLVISILINGPLEYGYAYVIKTNYNQIENIEVSNLFNGFKNYIQSFLIYLLRYLYILLWSLLFIIPGIIKAISYSMAYYIALDNPDINANDCISKSKEIMNGHKWDYFCLVLSYIGWIILCILTLGILSLWVMPKLQTARYIFYKTITSDI